MTPAVCPSKHAQARPRLQVPHPQRLVPTPRDRAPAVRRHAHAHRPIRVCPSSMRRHCPALQVPHPQRFVSTPRDRAPAVRRHAHAMTHPVPFQHPQALPVSRSHTRTVLSSLAETARRLSGVTLTLLTPVRVPFQHPQTCPRLQVPHPHRLVITDCPRPRAVRPASRLTLLTQSVCPFSIRRHAPVSTSHTRSVLSALPDTARRPSGVTLTLLTQSLCPSKVRKSAGLGL